ncbi:hypothetical protein MH117_13765 [Paenibacillus sp. ACRRX]|uniref:hypothetical protein n=1 Tax=Paenibacillus sp. ACRRX TaxID=2918206 RepID=UPI001EF6FD8B|nr:hypothetical protein [Paenibacillus sp. ACRRX]MCG7408493.1 hypothetical protein [Paenibacillus sp. ACRRX]
MNKYVRLLLVAALVSVLLPIDAWAKNSTPEVNFAEAAQPSDKVTDTEQMHGARKVRMMNIDKAFVSLGLGEDAMKKAMSKGQSLVEYAAANGVSRSQLLQALSDQLERQLQQELQQGTITNEKAARIKASMTAKLERMIDRKHSLAELAKQESKRKIFKDSLHAVLGQIGLSQAEVRKAAAAGHSLGDMAAAKGVSKKKLRLLFKSQVEQRVEVEVTGGKLTAEEGVRTKARILSHMDRWIEGHHDNRDGQHGQPMKKAEPNA